MTEFNVPLNDLSRLTSAMSPALLGAAGEVLDRGCFVLGPTVQRFEQAFARYCGVPHCVGVGNGTDALELALRALGVQPGDRVAVPANAGMYATTAVLAIGAQPWFIDVDPVFGLMTTDTALAGLQQFPHDTRPTAIVLTHLYGRLAATDQLLDAVRRLGIPMVEDCAQAHGARDVSGRRAGSFGEVAAFSFYPTKNLGALGDGGAVVTDDPMLAERVRQLRQYGWSEKYACELAGGRNSRLDEFQAAFLCILLPGLDARNTRRRAIANRYSQEIVNPHICVPPEARDEFVAHLYVVQCEQRDMLRAHLRSLGVASDVHYPIPDHRQPVHTGRYSGLSLAVSEQLSRRVLSLPCFPELTDQEVGQVISACNCWLATSTRPQ